MYEQLSKMLGKQNWSFAALPALIEENTPQHGAEPVGSYFDDHVSLDIPRSILAVVEPRERLHVENGVGDSVQDRDRLSARGAVPVEQIQRDFVRIAIADSDIDGEALAGILS